jgi:hypothetical protein
MIRATITYVDRRTGEQHSYEQDATARDMAKFFGLPSASQYPDDGIEEPKFIQGYRVWVDPKIPGKFRMRMMTECKTCHKQLPVGRLAQHERHVHDGVKYGRRV